MEDGIHLVVCVHGLDGEFLSGFPPKVLCYKREFIWIRHSFNKWVVSNGGRQEVCWVQGRGLAPRERMHLARTPVQKVNG